MKVGFIGLGIMGKPMAKNLPSGISCRTGRGRSNKCSNKCRGCKRCRSSDHNGTKFTKCKSCTP